MVDRYAVAFEYFGNTVPFLCIFQRPFRVVFHNGDMLRLRQHSLSGSVSFVGRVLSLRTVHCHLVSVTTRPAAVPCRGRRRGRAGGGSRTGHKTLPCRRLKPAARWRGPRRAANGVPKKA